MTTPEIDPAKVQQLLNLPLRRYVAEYAADGATDVRGYLVLLLSTVWRQAGDFSGKRAMGGGTDWQDDVYVPMVLAGMVSGKMDGAELVDVDTNAADVLIQAAIASLATAPPAPAGPPAPARTVIVTGSDDLIELDGDFDEEWPLQDRRHGDVLSFSDGTVLRIEFGSEAWRITPILLGDGHLNIDQAVGDERTDVATLTGNIRWAAHGNRYTAPAHRKSR